MKHIKAILSLVLVLSLAFGLVMPAGAADTTDAPLTVTRVVELEDRKIDVYFSEPITLTTANSMGICLINQAETEIPMRRTDAAIEAKWQRNIVANAGCITLAEDGSKLTFSMKADYEAIYYAETDIGPRGNSQYKIRFFVQDLGSSAAGNGMIDAITAKADSSKKLTANASVGGVDYALATVEYNAPFLKSVDKISNTEFRFNFSEAVTVSTDTRPTLAVVYKNNLAPVTRVVGSGSAQWIKSAGDFTASTDGLSVTASFDTAWINAAIKEYVAIGADNCEIHVRLLGNDQDTNCMVELIKDSATATKTAMADFINSEGGDAVIWNVSDAVCPKVVIGSVGYSSLANAFKSAVSGDVLKLQLDNDCAGETLVVPAGVTLDLNGKKLTVANVVSFGDVIDSVGGGALVMSNDRTEALLSLLPGNSMMPLYDTAAGAYKFFEYELENLGVKDETETSVKFGMRLSFTDAAAYDLLAAGQVDLGMQLQLVRNGKTTTLDLIFRDETVAAFAEEIKASSTVAIVLTVSGLSAGDSLTSAPIAQTAVGVNVQAEPVTYPSAA